MRENYLREDALNAALHLAGMTGAPPPTVETLLETAKKIEEYLKGKADAS